MSLGRWRDGGEQGTLSLGPWPLTFWSQPISTFRWLNITSLSDTSPGLTVPRIPGSRPPGDAGSRGFGSHLGRRPVGIESGKEVASPPPPPLRTVHAPFNAYGSSTGQRACRWAARGRPHWPWGRPGRYYGRAGYRDDLRWRGPHQQGSLRPRRQFCLARYAGWLTVHVRRHPREVSPLSGGVMSQPLSGPLPAGLRFLPRPLPAAPSARLAARFPSR